MELRWTRHRLRQIVDNLLTNVCTHTPPRTSVMIRVGANEGNAIIEVEDPRPAYSSASTGSTGRVARERRRRPRPLDRRCRRRGARRGIPRLAPGKGSKAAAAMSPTDLEAAAPRPRA